MQGTANRNQIVLLLGREFAQQAGTCAVDRNQDKRGSVRAAPGECGAEPARTGIRTVLYLH